MKSKLCARNGLGIGAIGISLVVLFQAFNSFVCYKHNIGQFLGALLFVAVPMLPGIVAMFTRSPFRALGAAAFFIPWLVYAFYVDCGAKHEGGSASMIYVAVSMWGLPSALIGALLTPRFRCTDASKTDEKNAA